MTRDDACTNTTNHPLPLLASGRAFQNQTKSASTIPSWNTLQETQRTFQTHDYPQPD